MKSLRMVFAGTPDFACPSLTALLAAGHQVDLVITQPDRPRGRGRHLTPPAVKVRAAALGLPVAQPEKIDAPDMRARLEAITPDAVVIVAFGQMIPPWLLALAPLGCLNVHASLLPKYRGAAPMQRALMLGDTETGVTIMQLDEGWDTGPLLAQKALAILPADDCGALHDRLAATGAALLVDALAAFAAGEIRPVPQDNSLATRAPKVKAEEMRLRWAEPAVKLHNLVRALAPLPLAETFFHGERLQIGKAAAVPAASEAAPGTVLHIDREGVTVMAGQDALLLAEVKPANGRLMPGADYAHGRRLEPGMRMD